MLNILDWIFPVNCLGCGRSGHYLCDACVLTINFNPHQRCAVCNRLAIDGLTHVRCKTSLTIDGVWALSCYRGVMRQAVRKLKYSLVRDLSSTFTNLMLARLPDSFRSFDMVMPVPLYGSRQRWRGFNQSEILAKNLAHALNLHHQNSLLRTRPTIPQAQLKSRVSRQENIRDIFSLPKAVGGTTFFNKSILIIDDIATTGTTLRQAAVPLKQAGAKAVWGLVWAR